MDARDLSRTEKLLTLTNSAIKLVREELAAGGPLETVYGDLQRHQHAYQIRLSELRTHNQQAQKQSSQAEEK